MSHEPFSVPEVLAGGIALATVVLIGFGGMRVAEPRNSLSAPARYAPVSIELSEASARLSLAQPRELPDFTEATQEVQSPDDRRGPGNRMPTPHPAAADHSAPAAATSPVGPRVQQHGIEAASLVTFADVIWGPPVSAPLRASRPADSPPRSPDPPSVRADSGFIGGWTDHAGRCSTGRKPPIAISSRAAKTASGECDFGFVARRTANRWRISALCTTGGKFWRANIALELREPNLTWSSERGTETYVRCRR